MKSKVWEKYVITRGARCDTREFWKHKVKMQHSLCCIEQTWFLKYSLQIDQVWGAIVVDLLARFFESDWSDSISFSSPLASWDVFDKVENKLSWCGKVESWFFRIRKSIDEPVFGNHSNTIWGIHILPKGNCNLHKLVSDNNLLDYAKIGHISSRSIWDTGSHSNADHS